MSKDLLKKLINLKLELVDVIIQELPEPVQEKAKCLEKEFMEALSEVASDYLAKQPETEKQKTSAGVNEIHID